MPIQNTYNPNPVTVDSLLKRRKTQLDLEREQGLIPEPEKPQPLKFFGVEQIPETPDKPFLRKVGEDAALLAYAIPVGLAQAVTHPIQFLKEAPGAIAQGLKETVDPDYYKAHPLLGVVNLAAFVQPIAGVAKTTAIKTATKTALNLGIKEAIRLGVEETVASQALKYGVFKTAVKEAAKTGKTEIVSEVVRNSLSKAGVADDIALRVGSEVSGNLYTTFSRQTAKMKVLEAITHPVGSSYRFLSGRAEPLRKALFGEPEKTAVATIYGVDTVKKNPEGFLSIERWAEAQVRERGFENTIANRQRIMQEWVEQNSQWASLSPEERITHFKNYAEQDLTRLKLHESTGIDVVTVKALPQNYVDAMIATIKEAPKELDTPGLIKVLEENFGNDFSIHSAEINQALTKLKQPTRASLISAVSKLGDARSTISFTKFSPEVQALAKQLEKTGYRIGHAPKGKTVSFAVDIFPDVTKQGLSEVAVKDIMATKSALGRWLDRFGFSTKGVVEGAIEFSYRENFTQRALKDLTQKYGSILKVGNVSIPIERLFEWIDKNRILIQESRQTLSLPIRTVFDVKADDLARIGFTKNVAVDIESISKQALRDIPVSVVGMGDAVINYLRTMDKGFGGWMSKWYDRYLKAAYKGRYDWSPFFSAQQFLETKLHAALLIKDPRLVPGAGTIQRLGAWSAERLGKQVEGTATYLRQIIDEPPLAQVSAVRDEILGTLQKTMLDYTSTPDIINVERAAKGGFELLKDKAAFEQSIRSRNLWYSVFGQSTARMATTFNKALASKFGMTLDDALSFTMENGVKKYKNPQMVQLMREATQTAFHYQTGVLTSPLMKTMNIIWFPLRFQLKSSQLVGRWMSSLSPAARMIVMNDWVHFANWAGTDEGIEWRRTNRNVLYNILAYTTAFEQLGQSLEAVSKGRLFGGNTGLIGGVPFGFIVNIARELAILPEDPDQFDPKTGRRFTKEIPRRLVSAAALSNALEQLIIQISPSTPFYSLSGGIIGGVSPRKWIESLVRQVVGASREALEGRDPSKGRQMLERDFKRVPLEYTRLAE